MKTAARALIALASIASLLAAPAVARADAAADVTDIRSGLLPVRAEWLGWEGSRAAHFRTLACSSGGTTSCEASFVAVAPSAPAKRTRLLDVVEVYCSPGAPCAALDKRTVHAFTAAERIALAALPQLSQTAPAPDATTVVGTVAGEDTRVEVRLVSTSAKDPTRNVVELVARGKGGAIERLARLDDQVYRLEASKIHAAYVSPDGKSVAWVVASTVGVMCWSFEGLSTPAVDLSRARASLANTIGFHAYKKRDLPGALAAFREATVHDAAFGLGWYNRASLESLEDDVAGARASFEKAKALDATFASRACRDRDFDALRAKDPELFACE